MLHLAHLLSHLPPSTCHLRIAGVSPLRAYLHTCGLVVFSGELFSGAASPALQASAGMESSAAGSRQGSDDAFMPLPARHSTAAPHERIWNLYQLERYLPPGAWQHIWAGAQQVKRTKGGSAAGGRMSFSPCSC
jgi:hypothetical protein